MPEAEMPAATGRPAAVELPSDEQVRVAVNSFAMLAEPTRLRLLWLVVGEELDVSTLASRIGATVPAVSAHLAKLRLAGLVETRKLGRRVLYRARDGHVRVLMAEALFHADHQVSSVAPHD